MEVSILPTRAYPGFPLDLFSLSNSALDRPSETIEARNPSLINLRPGFGASTPVPLALRIPTFLETVPLLLTHLEIAHISIACQSAGTFYALNLLTHHPELLSPINPSITFFSPWIHQSHSSVSFLTIASMLPNALLNHWNKVMSFMMNTLQPTFAVSGGAFTMVTSTFKDQVKTEKQKEEDAKKCLEGYGLPLDVKDELDGLIFKYVFAENTEGANDEARLCLRSVPGISWDAAEDYEECVKVLAEAWGRRVEEGGKPLSVSVHLPEEDIMVGDKGMMYFEECWKEENKGRGMKVECTRWKGTDHETTSSASHGAVGRMYSLVKGLRTVDSGMGGDVA
jgi:hypothetical protein